MQSNDELYEEAITTIDETISDVIDALRYVA